MISTCHQSPGNRVHRIEQSGVASSERDQMTTKQRESARLNESAKSAKPVVLFSMFIGKFSAMVARCGFTLNAQNWIWKCIKILYGFVQNVNFSTFRTLSLKINRIWRIRIDLIPNKGKSNDGISSNRTNQTNSLGGMKFISLKIDSIRGKKNAFIGLPWRSQSSYCGYSGNKDWQLNSNFGIIPWNMFIQHI